MSSNTIKKERKQTRKAPQAHNKLKKQHPANQKKQQLSTSQSNEKNTKTPLKLTTY